MKQVFAKAALTALVSTAVSLFLALMLAPVMEGVGEGALPVIAIVCPLVIAFPASAYLYYQKLRLAETLEALTSAHQRLAVAHEELAAAHAQLSEKARHDDMTGLLNRESFLEALKASRRRSDQGALLIIDADHFKYINDTHGHGQGDVALLMIARAIRDGVRAGDFVGRIGGEEFAAFLAGASEEEAMLVAERIRLGVEALHFSPGDGKLVPLSVSIGGARFNPHQPVTQMMREADNRLYEAKARGRNRVVLSRRAQHVAA